MVFLGDGVERGINTAEKIPVAEKRATVGRDWVLEDATESVNGAFHRALCSTECGSVVKTLIPCASDGSASLGCRKRRRRAATVG